MSCALCKNLLLHAEVVVYNTAMQKTRVGILRGGISPEYAVSLRTGESVLSALDESKYDAKDIFVDKQGAWHIGGFPVRPERIAREVDVVFNALHGEQGEDGKIQRLLESFRVPYTGARIVPSAIAMNKGLSKHCFEFYGIKTPRSVTVKRGDDIHILVLPFFREVAGKHVVKPISGGSSIGVVVADSFEDLYRAIELLLEDYSAVIVEEYIQGREITCGAVDGLNGSIYPLYPVEILKDGIGEIWDYDSKYNGGSFQVCPANLDEARFREIQRLAVEAHRTVGLRHYSRSDFIVSPRGIYLLEVNSLPGLESQSPIARSLKAADLNFSDFLDFVVTSALTKR